MRSLCLIALALLAACSEKAADPDLSGPDPNEEARIEAQARTLDEAADEAARIVEEDSAKAISEHRAETAAAIYAGQQADGDGIRQPDDRP
ncbi:hypothetical protein [Novosphingopyxis sp.]|uniref:hypothetical protein n=1 Tax=Novosphingopyxis sp. TaxID=2709690 RepID=UPI003B5BF1F0